MAGSGAGFATTGGAFSTRLCSRSIGQLTVKIGLTTALNQPVPQTKSTAQTIIHGVSDHHTSARLGCAPSGGGGGIVAAEVSWWRNAGDVQISAGCQTFRNRIRQPIEIRAAPISTIHGLMKFEIRYCGTAKLTPVTRIAGQTCTMPRQPAKAQISQAGTIREKNGNCRPTIAPRRYGSSPVTLARPAIGVPSAP